MKMSQSQHGAYHHSLRLPQKSKPKWSYFLHRRVNHLLSDGVLESVEARFQKRRCVGGLKMSYPRKVAKR